MASPDSGPLLLRSRLQPLSEGMAGRSSIGSGFEAVRLTISHVVAEDSVSSASNGFVMLVHTGDGDPVTSRTVGAGNSGTNGIQHRGDVCILGPRSRLEFLTSPREQLIQYRVMGDSLRAYASHRNRPEVDFLNCVTGEQDPIMHHLSQAMKRVLQSGSSTSDQFADSFIRSFYSHAIERYGVAKPATGDSFAGGLSPRHKRLLEEVLARDLDRGSLLNELAELCGLSTGHFARAFRKTFGLPFHKHLIRARIDRARKLLEGTHMELSVIARKIGYADQATFTESFKRVAGISPGRYRREYDVGMRTQSHGDHTLSSRGLVD